MNFPNSPVAVASKLQAGRRKMWSITGTGGRFLFSMTSTSARGTTRSQIVWAQEVVLLGIMAAGT